MPVRANNYDRRKDVSVGNLRSVAPNKQREVLIPTEVPAVQAGRFGEAIPDHRGLGG